MKRTLTFFIFAVTFWVVGIIEHAQAQTISRTIGGGTVSRGATARGVITMSIPSGLHVNSNRPSSEYAIPTTVRVTGAGIHLGAVSFPRGKNRKFQFSEIAINVYEGRVSFPFSVTVPANFKASAIKVRAAVRYQACTNEVCYPPKSREITITAHVL